MIYDIKLTLEGGIPRMSAIDIVSDIHGHYHGVIGEKNYYNLWKTDNTLQHRLEVTSEETVILTWLFGALQTQSYLLYERYDDVKNIARIVYGKVEDLLCLADLTIKMEKCRQGPCKQCMTFADCIQSGYKEKYPYIPKE